MFIEGSCHGCAGASGKRSSCCFLQRTRLSFALCNLLTHLCIFSFAAAETRAIEVEFAIIRVDISSMHASYMHARLVQSNTREERDIRRKKCVELLELGNRRLAQYPVLRLRRAYCLQRCSRNVHTC